MNLAIQIFESIINAEINQFFFSNADLLPQSGGRPSMNLAIQILNRPVNKNMWNESLMPKKNFNHLTCFFSLFTFQSWPECTVVGETKPLICMCDQQEAKTAKLGDCDGSKGKTKPNLHYHSNRKT